LAEYIYRNFPFVSHIAFMGLETTGLAWKNVEEIWIEPEVYADQLRSAILHLKQRDLCASIYNLPFCLLPRELWEFARDSISDWKKTYVDECAKCEVRESCPGVFSTSNRQSQHLRALTSVGRCNACDT